MRQLIYSSRWSDVAREDMGQTLQAVVGASIQNNRQVDVTGFLLAQDGMFLQLLEGPERSVAETFKRISGDARHDAITVIADAPVERRLFQQWNMAAAEQAGEAPRGLDADSAKAILLEAASGGWSKSASSCSLSCLRSPAPSRRPWPGPGRRRW